AGRPQAGRITRSYDEGREHLWNVRTTGTRRLSSARLLMRCEGPDRAPCSPGLASASTPPHTQDSSRLSTSASADFFPEARCIFSYGPVTGRRVVSCFSRSPLG